MTQATVAPNVVNTAPPRHKSPRRARAALSMVVQVGLIALGVFLGLAGEQWREDRDNHQAAIETLQRFRAEVVTNRGEVLRVKEYHSERHAELVAYFAASAEEKPNFPVRLAGGPRPPRFESTAWDLALATGTLSFIDAELASSLARLYAVQASANQLGAGLLESMYREPPKIAAEGFLGALELYYDDLTDIEAGLVPAYDTLLRAIDEALTD